MSKEKKSKCSECGDDLPDVFTIDELEDWEHNGKGTFTTYSILKRAVNAARRRHGVIYTQVDSETSSDRVYSKGLHYVNRTGVYAVLYPKT